MICISKMKNGYSTSQNQTPEALYSEVQPFVDLKSCWLTLMVTNIIFSGQPGYCTCVVRILTNQIAINCKIFTFTRNLRLLETLSLFVRVREPYSRESLTEVFSSRRYRCVCLLQIQGWTNLALGMYLRLWMLNHSKKTQKI